MKLIYRPRLGMSVGKLIAQLGHGVGLYQIGKFNKEPDSEDKVLKGLCFESMLSEGESCFEITKFESDLDLEAEEEEFKKKFKHVVIDAGLTAFNGVKTATVAVEFENSEEIHKREKSENFEIKSKMVVLIRKSLIKKESEENIIKYGVSAIADSCQVMLSQLGSNCFNFEQKSLAESWLFGRFAKIVRVLDDSDFRKAVKFVEEKSKFSSIYCKDEESAIIVLSPVESNDYQSVKELKGRLL